MSSATREREQLTTAGIATADDDVDVAEGLTVHISADDSASTHWPCGTIVPSLFKAGASWQCPRCGQWV